MRETVACPHAIFPRARPFAGAADDLGGVTASRDWDLEPEPSAGAHNTTSDPAWHSKAELLVFELLGTDALCEGLLPALKDAARATTDHTSPRSGVCCDARRQRSYVCACVRARCRAQRERLLAPGATIIPCELSLHVALVQSDDVRPWHSRSNGRGMCWSGASLCEWLCTLCCATAVC